MPHLPHVFLQKRYNAVNMHVSRKNKMWHFFIKNATSQTVDKVHGICRGFFLIKVPETQYLSGLEALFLV